MHAPVILCLCLVAALGTASVIPSWGGWGSGWDDYGHHHHHHVPVATSYASVWKVDHSVPVVWKAWPSYGWDAWDPHHHHHDHYDHHYDHHHDHHDHHDHYGLY